jgi:hypothetical protein
MALCAMLVEEKRERCGNCFVQANLIIFSFGELGHSPKENSTYFK